MEEDQKSNKKIRRKKEKENADEGRKDTGGKI